MSENKKVIKKKVVTFETLEDGTERIHVAEYETVYLSNGYIYDIAVGKNKRGVKKNDK